MPLPLSRRTVLRGGLVAVAAASSIPLIAACDSAPSPQQLTAESLLPLADAAYADADAARTLSARIVDYAAALRIVADQRGEHARALREEITRLHVATADRIVDPAAVSTSPSVSAESGAPAARPTPTPESVPEFRDRLRAGARGAGDVAVRSDGYVAGLTGAISAATTTMAEVALG